MIFETGRLDEVANLNCLIRLMAHFLRKYSMGNPPEGRGFSPQPPAARAATGGGAVRAPHGRRSGAAGAALPAGMVHLIVPLQQDLRHRHDPEAVLQQILDHIRQGLRRVLGRVVEQHDIPALNAARHPLRNLRRAQVLPVQTVPDGNGFKGKNTTAKPVSGFLYTVMIHSRSMLSYHTNHLASMGAAGNHRRVTALLEFLYESAGHL